jgi:hypothetical protein
MTANIVEALMQWCEGNRDTLRHSGVALRVVGAIEEHGGKACVDLESAKSLWRVTVWNHMAMCDVDQLDLSSNEMFDQHHENLNAGQLVDLMDGLAAQARTGSGP